MLHDDAISRTITNVTASQKQAPGSQSLEGQSSGPASRVASAWKRVSAGVAQDLAVKYEVVPKMKGDIGVSVQRKQVVVVAAGTPATGGRVTDR